MAVTDLASVGPKPSGTGLSTPTSPKANPVRIWAFVGGCFAALTLYCLVRWVALGNVHPTPVGDTSQVSDWTWFWVRLNEGLVVAVCLFMMGRYVIRPWRRDRRLSWDGMFVLAWAGLWLQDPLSNSARIWFNYSSLFVNLGCWQCHAPGWLPTHPERYTEPILFIGVMYAGLLPAWAMICCWFMRKAKERRPQTGPVGLVGVAILASFTIDYILEIPWLHMNLYAYTGSIRWLSIFPGTRSQLPLTEALTMGLFAGLAGALRYFRNDRGQSLAERGIDDVNTSSRKKAGLRFLAVYGMLQVIFLIGYTMPNFWLSLHGGARPSNAYSDQLTNLMCGPHTDQACAGPKVPAVVGPDSARVTPDGRLYAPSGLPDETGRR